MSEGEGFYEELNPDILNYFYIIKIISSAIKVLKYILIIKNYLGLIGLIS